LGENRSSLKDRRSGEDRRSKTEVHEQTEEKQTSGLNVRRRKESKNRTKFKEDKG
jgi:hypothetical protein